MSDERRGYLGRLVRAGKSSAAKRVPARFCNDSPETGPYAEVTSSHVFRPPSLTLRAALVLLPFIGACAPRATTECAAIAQAQQHTGVINKVMPLMKKSECGRVVYAWIGRQGASACRRRVAGRINA